MKTTSSPRRQVLGAIALLATAGCTAFSSESGIQVGNISIENWRDESVTITVRLDRAGSAVFEDAIEVDSNGRELIEQSWETEPVEYTIMYSMNGEGRITNLSLPEDMRGADGDCIDIQIHCRPSETDIVFRDDNPPWGRC
ncbi:hypothetical protein [Halopiger xanaduensis]|uniref:hypothetical protein n=1 Tax=Halopiger xanaduensis TaxID=387343 RepID=UPI0011D25C04|nr:hypothetical protein [Halopiger xanaduensis]